MTKEELKEKVKEAIENALYTTGFTTIECSDYADIIMVYLKDIESDLDTLLRETAENAWLQAQKKQLDPLTEKGFTSWWYGFLTSLTPGIASKRMKTIRSKR